MRLSLPPFDDLHVRRALNLALNKAVVLQARGGTTEGSVATHILPPSITGDTAEMDDRDPYATPNHEGDKAAARAEMSLSRYDRDQDGRCDGRVCAVTRVQSSPR